MNRGRWAAIVGVVAVATLAVWPSAADQAADGVVEPTERIDLLAGGLDNWVLYLGDGNADPADTYQLADGVLSISGQPFGYLRTRVPYRNYRLHLEWRWPAQPGNSGLLMHIQRDDKVWPYSIESQQQSGSAGDFWFIDGARSSRLPADAEGRHVGQEHPSNERPAGEWNTKDVVCSGDQIAVFVNGLLQNTAAECVPSRGFIGLQSEGAPIEFRQVVIEPLVRPDSAP